MTDSVLDAQDAFVDDASPVGDLQNVLLRTLAVVEEPLTVAVIDQQLPRPYRGDPERLTVLLGLLIDAGQVHRYSPYRGKADRFWDRAPIDYAEILLTTQTHGRFATRSELITQFKARCRDVSIKRLEALIKELAKSGKLQSGKFLGSRAVRYSADPIDATAVASNAMEQIAKRFSLSHDQLQQLLVDRLVDSSPPPTPLPKVSTLEENEGKREIAVTDDDAKSLIWDAIEQICPAGGGSIVPISEVRRVLTFKVDRETLDDSLRSLERDGRIDFTVHPDPSGLTGEQLSDQLTDRSGKVFDMLIVRR